MGLIILLVIALGLVAVATLQFHTRHLQQSLADEAQRHAATLAEIDDGEMQQEYARALRRQPGILHAGFSSDDTDTGDGDEARVWIDDYDDQAAIWASAGSDYDGEERVVVLSLADAQSAADDGRRALIIYLVSTLLFVTLVGYGFFSFVVIRPLRALGVATQRAANGDLASPVTILPRNEFGQVGNQFNQMLEQLQSQRAELQDQVERLRRAHRELQETQESLIRSEKMASVGHLAAGIAHEVGNPLAAVMGYTDLLRDRSLDEETADDLADRSLDQLKRIQEIIRQLLDYSRSDPDKEPTAVDVKKVIDESLHLVRATPEGGDVDIDVDVDDDLPDAVAIEGELEQVVVNLLLNAIEAMEKQATDDPRIFVGVDVDDERLIVDIRDTGPGIDEDVADQIFDPFFTTRDPGEGTGLGLAIAQQLADRVGGHLELVDNDNGAHFRIELQRFADS